MPRFEVTYSIVNNITEGDFGYSGPSNYTTNVEAFNQVYAENMVRNSNGGSAHCLVRSCRMIG